MAASCLALPLRICVSITLFAWLCSALLCHQVAVSPSLCLPDCVLPYSITEKLCLYDFVCMAVCCLAMSLISCVSITLLAWLCPALLRHREYVSSSLCFHGCVLPCFVTKKLCLHHFFCLAVSCLTVSCLALSPTKRLCIYHLVCLAMSFLALTPRSCVFITVFAWLYATWVCY
jgi:hypothetical protein